MKTKLAIVALLTACRKLDGSKARTIRRKFQPQFHEAVTTGRKTQTVRPRSKRPPRPGDLFVAESWTGRACNSKVKELACGIVTECFPVDLTGIFGDPIDGEAFAKRDGFSSLEEMRRWFAAAYRKTPENTECIRWKPL